MKKNYPDNLKFSELKEMTSASLGEKERSIRMRLNKMKMDIFNQPEKHCGEKRVLRKALARVLTANTLQAKNRV